jgi:DNA-binding CsgD family transcriptional regulator
MWRLDKPQGLKQVSVLGKREAEAYLLLSDEHRDLTIAETAEEMGIKPDTVRGKIGQIRRKIRQAELTQRLSL